MPTSALHSEAVRSHLLARREVLAVRQRRVRRDLSHAQEPLSADFADQAVQTQNDETLQEIGESARQEIEQIDAALQRLAEGRYGICAECGSPIDDARLVAVPHALACSACSRR